MIKVSGYYYNSYGYMVRVDKDFKTKKQAESYCDKIAEYDYGACEFHLFDEKDKCYLTIRSA